MLEDDYLFDEDDAQYDQYVDENEFYDNFIYDEDEYDDIDVDYGYHIEWWEDDEDY